MDLSIIITNYESKGLLRQCLKGIKLMNIDLKFEVIVVDNGSKDRVDQVMKTEFKQFMFIRNEINRGMGAGNNTGILKASGKYVFIVNPDITILDDSILNLIHFLDNNQNIGLAGPKILNPDGSTQNSYCQFPKTFMPIYRRHFKHDKVGIYDQKEIQEPLSVDCILASCFMVKRSVLDEVGLFDERFFLFMEDIDLCRRIKNAGWGVWYCPYSKVINYPLQLDRKKWTGFKSYFSKYTWIHINSSIKYLKKWGIGRKH